MSQFSGKTALISGGGEGIGLSIAQALGKEGMNIVLADIDQGNLDSAKAQLEQASVPVLAVKLDVADAAQWQEAVDLTIETFGKIHMLVNNAGVGGETGPLEGQQTDGWQWSLDVNLLGVVKGAQAVVPTIKAQGEGGWIVNVASMAGMGGVPFGGAYTATKFAVVGLSEGWAMELGKSKIAVSVLCPGFVKTRIHESDRNRPESETSSISMANINDKAREQSKQLVENGIDVSIVGERTVEALKAGEFYIFTHPNFQKAMQKRAKAIDDAMTRAAASPLLEHIVDMPIETF